MLILLPNLLHPESKDWEYFLPCKLKDIVNHLDGLFVESEKEARRYLLRFMSREKMQGIQFCLLNEHVAQSTFPLKEMIAKVKTEQWGVLSDAGLPCLADPGAFLVLEMRKHNIPVQVVSGPSSILFALMLSGFSGQQFAFHGYFPKDKENIEKMLKKCEKFSEDATQIWIERPYQTQNMVNMVLTHLQPSTYFCLAQNITFPEETVITLSVQEWRKKSIVVKNVPSVFLMRKILT